MLIGNDLSNLIINPHAIEDMPKIININIKNIMQYPFDTDFSNSIVDLRDLNKGGCSF